MYCNGRLEPQRVTRLQRYQAHWVVIENVPALVCRQCGEQYFTPEAHHIVVNILRTFASQQVFVLEQWV